MPRTVKAPAYATLNAVLELARRVSALERGRPQAGQIDGPRSDDPAGDGSLWGARLRWGLLSDGSYGVERWASDGTRTTPTWS